MSGKDKNIFVFEEGGPAFSHTISHEIKAPLRAIDGYARIFLEDFGEELPPTGQEMIETIRHICSDTISMADMLLEYARLSRMEPNNLLIDLRKLFKDVFMAMDHTGKGGRTPDLTFDPEIPHIVGDEGLFRQALLNILSNAVKFTQTKENPEIRVGYERTDESHIFYVRDNGVGFDMKYADKLFDMFQRMHSSDEFEGSGVGLSIIKKILDIHQGKVWIEGAVDQGATIYFSLPDARVLCE